MNRMYRENVKSLNAFVGCNFNCVYCVPSFQRNMKRQRKNCERCYKYDPHFHPERLLKKPPKTEGNEFIFFPSSGDPSFAQPKDFLAMIYYAQDNPNSQFLIQTKSPKFLRKYSFPDNVILGITLETNQQNFNPTPSKYKKYSEITSAPRPFDRYLDFVEVNHWRKIVTIEPILDFQTWVLEAWIRHIDPEAVYIGYDNHSVFLPEPILPKTQQLTHTLGKFTQLRMKTLRKAWYE